MWYPFWNAFFFVFHTGFTLFNVLGWIFPQTRKWNLITLMLTAFSWFILGIWYGWGYCFCTDWHWQVRRHMGIDDHENSYIHFLVRKLSGIDFSLKLVENWTLAVFLVSVLMSIWLNIRDLKRKRAGKNKSAS